MYFFLTGYRKFLAAFTGESLFLFVMVSSALLPPSESFRQFLLNR